MITEKQNHCFHTHSFFLRLMDDEFHRLMSMKDERCKSYYRFDVCNAFNSAWKKMSQHIDYDDFICELVDIADNELETLHLNLENILKTTDKAYISCYLFNVYYNISKERFNDALKKIPMTINDIFVNSKYDSKTPKHLKNIRECFDLYASNIENCDERQKMMVKGYTQNENEYNVIYTTLMAIINKKINKDDYDKD